MAKSRVLIPLVTAVVLTAGVPAGALAGAAPGTGGRELSTSFVLGAKVLDGGQQIVSLTLDVPPGTDIDPDSLTTSTFAVHAKGMNPFAGTPADKFTGEFDTDRTVTAVQLDKSGDIVVQLAYGPDVPGAATFGYNKQESRNVMLDLRYTITQKRPVSRTDGSALRFTAFSQGAVTDKEAGAFTSGKSRSGLAYRVFTPARAGKSRRPLILWLHGGGEGGWARAYDNDLPLVANRGALGFATPEAQRIFGGAYVLAPQAWTRWLDDASYSYTRRLKSLVDEFTAQHDIDPERIYLAGPSNGGYMTLKMAATYPELFAANVTICPAVKYTADGVTHTMLTAQQLRAVRSTPTWIVQATSDTVLPFKDNGRYAASIIGNAELTTYPAVVRDGHEYNAHWSWIYVARNNPRLADGTTIFEWMAQQQRG